MTVSVGSGTVSLKTDTANPAAESGSRQLPTWPHLTMNGSVTTSGRDSPNFASTSAIWRTAPAATSNRRGEAKFMLIAVIGGSSAPRSKVSPAASRRHDGRHEAWKYASIDAIFHVVRSNVMRTTLAMDDDLVSQAQQFTGVQ